MQSFLKQAKETRYEEDQNSEVNKDDSAKTTDVDDDTDTDNEVSVRKSVAIGRPGINNGNNSRDDAVKQSVISVNANGKTNTKAGFKQPAPAGTTADELQLSAQQVNQREQEKEKRMKTEKEL